MAKKSLDIAQLAVAITVAIIGVVPVAWLLTQPDSAPRSESPSPVLATTPAAEAATAIAPPEPEVATAGLHRSIVNVLMANGYATGTARSDLEAVLATPVVNVLIANGAVLTVPDSFDLETAGSTGGAP